MNVDDIIKNFATDLLNTILVQLEKPYISASGKRFKGLDKRSSLYNSMQVSWDSTPNILVEGLDYLKFIDQGRKAGARKIPIQVILRWIKKRNIKPRNAKGQFKAMTLNQLAFVIQRSIFKIGIRPRNIIRTSFEQIDELYKLNVETGIQEIIQGLIVTINNDLIKTTSAIYKIKPNRVKAK